MAHEVVLIPGDGIGPEITRATTRVIESAGVDIAWREYQAGAGVIDESASRSRAPSPPR